MSRQNKILYSSITLTQTRSRQNESGFSSDGISYPACLGFLTVTVGHFVFYFSKVYRHHRNTTTDLQLQFCHDREKHLYRWAYTTNKTLEVEIRRCHVIFPK